MQYRPIQFLSYLSPYLMNQNKNNFDIFKKSNYLYKPCVSHYWSPLELPHFLGASNPFSETQEVFTEKMVAWHFHLPYLYSDVLMKYIYLTASFKNRPKCVKCPAIGPMSLHNSLCYQIKTTMHNDSMNGYITSYISNMLLMLYFSE